MKTFIKIFLVLLVISLPILLATTAIRIALTPVYVSVEYQMPGFPADDYGFTTADRLTWSRYSVDYLLGRITHAALTNQRLPDGSPLFNERELSHMLDVRNLTAIVLKVWLGLLAFFILAAVLSWAAKAQTAWFSALRSGAALTLVLIFAILFYLTLNFNQLFTQFHQLFFQGDSWLFLMSDNLIRLFPIRFWRDIFIFIGGLCILMAALLIMVSNRYLKKNKSDSSLRSE